MLYWPMASPGSPFLWLFKFLIRFYLVFNSHLWKYNEAMLCLTKLKDHLQSLGELSMSGLHSFNEFDIELSKKIALALSIYMTSSRTSAFSIFWRIYERISIIAVISQYWCLSLGMKLAQKIPPLHFTLIWNWCKLFKPRVKWT